MHIHLTLEAENARSALQQFCHILGVHFDGSMDIYWLMVVRNWEWP
jgi:hypothetical protein